MDYPNTNTNKNTASINQRYNHTPTSGIKLKQKSPTATAVKSKTKKSHPIKKNRKKWTMILIMVLSMIKLSSQASEKIQSITSTCQHRFLLRSKTPNTDLFFSNCLNINQNLLTRYQLSTNPTNSISEDQQFSNTVSTPSLNFQDFLTLTQVDSTNFLIAYNKSSKKIIKILMDTTLNTSQFVEEIQINFEPKKIKCGFSGSNNCLINDDSGSLFEIESSNLSLSSKNTLGVKCHDFDFSSNSQQVICIQKSPLIIQVVDYQIPILITPLKKRLINDDSVGDGISIFSPKISNFLILSTTSNQILFIDKLTLSSIGTVPTTIKNINNFVDIESTFFIAFFELNEKQLGLMDYRTKTVQYFTSNNNSIIELIYTGDKYLVLLSSDTPEQASISQKFEFLNISGISSKHECSTIQPLIPEIRCLTCVNGLPIVIKGQLPSCGCSITQKKIGQICCPLNCISCTTNNECDSCLDGFSLINSSKKCKCPEESIFNPLSYTCLVKNSNSNQGIKLLSKYFDPTKLQMIFKFNTKLNKLQNFSIFKVEYSPSLKNLKNSKNRILQKFLSSPNVTSEENDLIVDFIDNTSNQQIFFENGQLVLDTISDRPLIFEGVDPLTSFFSDFPIQSPLFAVCPKNEYDNQGKCEKCPSRCQDCLKPVSADSPVCLSCQEDQILTGGVCLCQDGAKNLDSEGKCKLFKGINLSQFYFSQKLESIYITFNESVIVNQDLNNFNIEVDGLKNSSSISLKSVESHSKNTLKFNLKISDEIVELNNNQIKISSDSPIKIRDSKNSRFFNNYPIKVPIKYYKDPDSETSTNVSKGSSRTSLFLTIISLLTSPSTAIRLMRFLQTLGLLSFINVKVPTVVLEFIDELDLNIFKIIPNIFEIDENPYKCGIHPKLEENEVKCLSMNAVGSTILQIFIIIILKLLVSIHLIVNGEMNYLLELPQKLRVCFRGKGEDGDTKKEENSDKEVKSKEKNNIFLFYFLKICRFINNWISLFFYFNYINAALIDLYIGSWPSIKSLNEINLWSIISNIIIIFLVFNTVVYLLLIIAAFYDYYLPRSQGSYSDEELKIYEKENDKFLELFKEQIRENTNYGIWSLFLTALRDMILPIFLIYLVTSPIIQLASITLFTVIILILLIITVPMPSVLENFLEIFNNVSYLLCLIIFILIFSFEEGMDPKKVNTVFGYPLLTIMTVMLIVNLFVSIVQIIMALVEFIRDNCAKKTEEDDVKNNNSKEKSDNTVLNESQMELKLNSDKNTKSNETNESNQMKNAILQLEENHKNKL